MLKHRSKIKRSKAQLLGGQFIVEYKVYVPRGSVNTSFFNVYKIVKETESYFFTDGVPLVEMQMVRNHHAKARGEEEWSFDFLYNADDDPTWVALGITDPNQFLRSNSEVFVGLIQKREDDYKAKIENRKKLLAEKRAKKKLEEEVEKSLEGNLDQLYEVIP
jgi:hypothetical protein